MHRNHKVTGGGGLVLLCLAATLTWGGCKRNLTSYDKNRARKALSRIDQAEREVTDTEKRLQAIIDEDKAFMSKTRTVAKARARLAKHRAAIAAAKKTALKVRKLLKANKGADRMKLERHTRDIQKKLSDIQMLLLYVVDPVRKLRNAKKNAKKLIQEVKDSRKLATTYPPSPVAEAVAQAAKKYPKAKVALGARLKALVGKEINTLADAFDKAQRMEPPDYLAMGTLVNKLRTKKVELGKHRKEFLTHILQLDDHVDVILVDMKDERTRFFHRYKRVQGKKVTSTGWKPVSAHYFRMHQDHLGMALYAKPKGTFHTNAIRLASPPGYAYVNNDEYGKWSEAPKTKKPKAKKPKTKKSKTKKPEAKTWQFHPQYSYMVPLFFGAGVAVVTWAAYQAYLKHRARRQVFYGLGGAIWYGTRSARNKKKYKHFYKRRARKIRLRRVRRSGSRRSGRSSRGSRRSGK